MASNTTSAPRVTRTPVRAVQQHLFAEPELPVYAILDAAAAPGLLDAMFEHQVEHACLYSSEPEPDIAEVAPYVARVGPQTPFVHWLIEQGWGQNWGVFAASEADLRAVRRHLRSLLIAYDPDGKPVYFRWYDPRVLRVYLPTCNAEETRLVFGPVRWFAVEGEGGTSMVRIRPAGALPEQEFLMVIRTDGG